jgi:hypothetical protein
LSVDLLLLRLFAFANEVAEREIGSEYSGIAEVKGSYGWSFLEHLTELPESGKAKLLRALVKRRFAMEGLRLPETTLSEGERLEIEHWLKHSNSMHGMRQVPFFAMSIREEEFLNSKAQPPMARRIGLQAALRKELESCGDRIQILSEASHELRWCTVLPNHYRVVGWVDLGKSGEQAATFVAVYHPNAKQPGHIPTSFLGIMGIGETSWRFLQHGQENLMSASTIQFYLQLCSTISQ